MFLAATAGLLVQGCAGEMHATNSGVTTLENYMSGRFVPTQQFTSQDVICFYVSVTWEDVTQEAGWRYVVWNWYKDGKLVVHQENDHAYFKGAPNTRVLKRPAAALGTGHFRAECLIGGQKMAEAEFDII